MFSKNNVKMNLQKEADRHSRFSIRKLSVGAASVMIGCFLYTQGNNVVSADTINSTTPNDQTSKVESDTHNEDQSTSASQDEHKNGQQANGQVASPAEHQEPTTNEAEQARKEAKVLPQTAIKGEDPELDPSSLLNGAANKAQGIDQNDTKVTATWTKKPDVSKDGQTEGEAKVTHTSKDKDGKDVTKSVDVTVPVTVHEGQKKQADQVRNTLNVIDQDSNQILFSHSWLGKKDPNANPQYADNTKADIIDSDIQNLKSELEYLGYTEVSDPNANSTNSIDPQEYLRSFEGHDKVASLIVKPVVQKPVINDSLTNNPDLRVDGQTALSDMYNHVVPVENTDPADYLYGLGILPKNATVSWGVKPVFDVANASDGSISSLILKNNPTIEISEGGKVTKVISGNKLDSVLFDAYISKSQEITQNPNSVGKIEFRQSDKVPDAVSAISAIPVTDEKTDTTKMLTGQEAQDYLKANYDVSWSVAPDPTHAGYQYAFYKLTPKNDKVDEYNYPFSVLVQVALDKINENQEKDVTRTIHYIVPTGYPKFDDETQTVVFTRTKTTDPMNGLVSYTDWTPTKGSWSQKDVKQILGYISYIDGVAGTQVGAESVTEDSANETVVVTYEPTGTTSIPDTPSTTPDQPTNAPTNPTPSTPSNQPTTSTTVNTPTQSKKPAKTVKKSKGTVATQTGISSIGTTSSESTPNTSTTSSSLPMTGTVQAATINNSSDAELPQTGDSEDSSAVILGAVALGATGLTLAYFDLDHKKKRN